MEETVNNQEAPIIETAPVAEKRLQVGRLGKQAMSADDFADPLEE